jgi:hypothetical protein
MSRALWGTVGGDQAAAAPGRPYGRWAGRLGVHPAVSVARLLLLVFDERLHLREQRG